jgi:soluble lytic murein transglycosylase-like protein
MLSLCLFAAVIPQVSQPAPAFDLAGYEEEAAQKSGLPATLIRAVVRVESNENPRAISAKGALGLLQLMPATWTILSRQLNLGTDPFDPHDNLLAGAIYLRALYDRYGASGFLTAYNAGAGRYEAYRDKGQPLPLETVNYVQRISKKLEADGTRLTELQATPVRPIWQAAALFVSTDECATRSHAIHHNRFALRRSVPGE